MRQEAHHLDDLTRHPGWPILVRAVEKVKEKDYRELVSPADVPVRKFDYDRGKLAGMMVVLDIAGKAMSTFKVAEKTARTVGVGE